MHVSDLETHLTHLSTLRGIQLKCLWYQYILTCLKLHKPLTFPQAIDAAMKGTKKDKLSYVKLNYYKNYIFSP